MKSVTRAASITIATLLVLAGCELPPQDTVQRGYRGTGMELVISPERLHDSVNANQPPTPAPAMSSDGPKAKDIYKNVWVLGDLSVGEFTRLMAAMTEWVAPEQGCNYCHNPADLSDDSVYTKKVARMMITMTRETNQAWKSHVGDTGVTCYTCHRGKNIPDNVWSKDPGPKRATGMVGQAPQNYAASQVGLTSLPYDPFTPLLQGDGKIGGVQAKSALPQGHKPDIKDTEWTYALMMHFSQSLGVGCVYCHNSRAFASYEEASPAKVTAWHGIRMVREINNKYIEETTPWLPAHRKGPQGDALKANCETCHQGAYKPLYGAQMLKHYPNLAKAGD